MNGHGGKRPGAGRPKKAERYAAPIAAAEDRIADRLPRLLANLELLADGGYEQITETFEPAGLIQITEEVVTSEGTVNVKKLAFPDLEPTTLVCVRRTRSIAAPDRAANVYLIDRILGRPVAAVEAEVEVNAGQQLLDAFGAAVAKIYGEAGAEDTEDGR